MQKALTLTEIAQIWYMLLREKPGVVVPSTSAKYLKLLKVASSVIRLKSETPLEVNTKISYMTISLNVTIPLKMLR